jgi:hypothetical protein
MPASGMVTRPPTTKATIIATVANTLRAPLIGGI